MDTEASKPEQIAQPIWRCKSPDCKAWMREELTAEPSPECPICKGDMIRGIKHLPRLVTRYKKKRNPLIH